MPKRYRPDEEGRAIECSEKEYLEWVSNISNIFDTQIGPYIVFTYLHPDGGNPYRDQQIIYKSGIMTEDPKVRGTEFYLREFEDSKTFEQAEELQIAYIELAIRTWRRMKKKDE